MNSYEQYDNPLIRRYASREMSFLFSPQFKHQTWRKLWIHLAEAEKELGLPISSEQIAELKAHETDIDFAAAEAQGKGSPPRRHGARACLWRAMPQGRRDHPSGRDLGLCRGQHGSHPDEGRPSVAAQAGAAGDRFPGAFRESMEGAAHAWVHAFSARATRDRGQARLPVDTGSAAGPGRVRRRSRKPSVSRRERARRARRRASWNCSEAITRR